MKKLIIAVACIVALASCSNDNKTTGQTDSKTTPQNNTSQTVNTTTQQPNVQVPPTQQPTSGQVSTGQQPNIQVNQPPADGGQAPKSGTINPPHGQPGHSCSVKEGEMIP